MEHPAQRRLGDRAAWWLAFVAFGCLGTMWALASPLMSIPDEPAHAVKAAAVARGNLDGRVVTITRGNEHVVVTHVTVPAGIATDTLMCFAFRANVPAGCEPPRSNDRTLRDTTTTAGAYPPAYYALVGWPSRILAPTRALYAMRLCSVAVGAALLASGLASARAAARRRLTVVGAAVAATPMAFFLIGSINPNGFEIAAAFATWLVWLELVTRREPPSTRLLVRAAVVSSAFVLARPLSPLFFAFTVLVVLALGLTTERARQLAADTRVRITMGALAVVGVLSLAWIVSAGTADSLQGTSIPGLTFLHAFHLAYDRLWDRTREMVGVFGWLDTWAAARLTLGWLLGVAVLVVVALVVGRWRTRLVLLATLVATFLAPLLLEAYSAPRVGFVWQGRYGLPMAMGVPIVAAWIIADSTRWYTDLARVRLAAEVVLVGTAGVVAFAQFFAFGVALSRYVVGVPSTFLAYLHGTGWSPPGSQWGLFALSAISCALYAVTLVVFGRERPPGNDTPIPIEEPGDGHQVDQADQADQVPMVRSSG